jgi:hypothetical protein
MIYHFHDDHNFYEFHSWDDKIISAPTVYSWTLGKPVSTLVSWFKQLNYTMEVRNETAGDMRISKVLRKR